jgi:hypothetical protein
MRTRVKRSVVWKMPDDEFEALVKQSASVGEICRKLSGRKGGSVFSNIKHRIELLALPTIHFIDGRCGTYSPVHVSKEEFLRRLDAKEPMDPSFVKKKLLEFSILKNECSECGLSSVWKGKPLVLILDHRDGDFTNNIISNFRLLCPNCNSQTSTFSMGKRIKKDYHCVDCGNSTSGYGTRCLRCACLEREKRKKLVGNIGIEPMN